MRVRVRDGVIESAEPEGMYGYIDIPFKDWYENIAYT